MKFKIRQSTPHSEFLGYLEDQSGNDVFEERDDDELLDARVLAKLVAYNGPYAVGDILEIVDASEAS